MAAWARWVVAVALAMCCNAHAVLASAQYLLAHWMQGFQLKRCAACLSQRSVSRCC
jgi:hypothetical protein